MKTLSDRTEGYMSYPDGYRHWSLAAANKAAKAESKNSGSARVEGAYSNQVYSRWSWGRKVSGREGSRNAAARNPGKGRAVRLKGFTGTITKTKSGQVVIRGKGRRA
jgi:hypothetical protein